MGKLRVLMIEENPDDAELIRVALRDAGIDCEWAQVQTREAYLAAAHDQPDLVLCASSVAEFTALEALRLLTEASLDLPLIVIADVRHEDIGLESLRRGAIDYLRKDRLAGLASAVTRAQHLHKLKVSHQHGDRDTQRMNAMLRGVVDNAPAAVYVKDRDGRYLVANARHEEILGVTAGGAIGHTDHDLLPEQLAQVLADQDLGDLDEARTRRREVELRVGDEHRTFLSVCYPIQLAADSTSVVGGILTDITTMKRIEGDLRSARAELRRQTASLEQDNLDLRELDRVKAEFLESVSHELRTPLTLINGTIELLQEGQLGRLTPPEQELVATMEKAGSRLYGTIIDLLTVFQMDRGGFALDVRPTQLTEVIQRALATVEPLFAPANLALSVDVPPSLPLVLADGDQIGRVLLNLVTNAIKFSPEGGTVTVSAEPRGSEVVITVRDTGVGIPKSEQTRVFLRFRRGRRALREAKQGTGLGLAISKEVIERHHGWIDLESEEGKGTTVTFGVPGHPQPPAQPALAPLTPQPSQ